jgi:hypothetical protein
MGFAELLRRVDFDYEWQEVLPAEGVTASMILQAVQHVTHAWIHTHSGVQAVEAPSNAAPSHSIKQLEYQCH